MDKKQGSVYQRWEGGEFGRWQKGEDVGSEGGARTVGVCVGAVAAAHVIDSESVGQVSLPFAAEEALGDDEGRPSKAQSKSPISHPQRALS